MESLNRPIKTPRTVVAKFHFRFFNMYSFVLSFLFVVNINEISGVVTSPTPNPDVELSVIPLDSNGIFNFTFNVHVEPPRFYEKSFVVRKIREDDFVTNEIGAHKLSRRELAWNRASRICMQEGGNYIQLSFYVIHKLKTNAILLNLCEFCTSFT